MLKPFRVLAPTTVAEASAELARLGEQAKVYAGGAEVLLLLRTGLVHADHLVDVKRIPGLGELSWNGGVLTIGATVTHHRLERDPLVRAHIPTLAAAESTIGNIRIRCQGTLGGNLCFNDPHADSGTALLVYDASVRIGGGNGERELGLSDFLLDTYTTALEPDEVLTAVDVPALPPGWGSAFLRIERFHRPTVNVAAAARMQDGRLEGARLAVGCVGPTALRLSALETRLQGLPLEDALRVTAESKPYLREQLQPVDDLLGSADYKIHVASVLLGRALRQAAQGNGSGQHG